MIIDFDSKNNGGGGKPVVVEQLSVTENGTYTPQSGVDGFNPVEVNVAQSGGKFQLKYIEDIEIQNKDIETFDKTGLDLSGFLDNSVWKWFLRCSKIKRIDLGSATPAVINETVDLFYGCSSLIEVNLTNWDLSNCQDRSQPYYNHTDLTDMFYGCTNLENIIWNGVKFPSSMSNPFTDAKLDTCTKLTVDSLMNLIDNLPTVTSTRYLKIGTTNISKLSDEQKAIATDKNWQLR